MVKKLIVLGVVLVFSTGLCPAKIKLVDSYRLENNGKNERLIQAPVSFFVTREGKLFLLDGKAANIKIYGKRKMVKVFGRRGLGPNEFIAPGASAYWPPYMALHDLRRDQLFIYRIDKGSDPKLVHNTTLASLVREKHFLNDHTLVISGLRNHPGERNAYSVFSYDWKRDRYRHHLRAIFSFDCESESRFEKLFIKQLAILSPFGCMGIGDDSILFCPSTRLRCIAMNREFTITRIFGRQTSNFVQPQVTVAMRQAHQAQNARKVAMLLEQYSFVLKALISLEGGFTLLYSRYSGNRRAQDIMVQEYGPGGEWIDEYLLMETGVRHYADLAFYQDRDQKNLYLLLQEPDEDDEMTYRLLRFEISG